MNLIPKLAEMLGVEIGEEFKLKQTNGDIKSAKYRFRNIGNQIIYEHTDYCGDWTMCSAEEVGLLAQQLHGGTIASRSDVDWEVWLEEKHNEIR